MDSLTQIALGAAVGVAVMGRRTAVWKAALWGAVCGTLPDLGAFIDHGDPILDMTRHRAIQHRAVAAGGNHADAVFRRLLFAAERLAGDSLDGA